MLIYIPRHGMGTAAPERERERGGEEREGEKERWRN